MRIITSTIALLLSTLTISATDFETATEAVRNKNARDWYLFHLLYNSKILAKRFGIIRNSSYLCHLYLLQL